MPEPRDDGRYVPVLDRQRIACPMSATEQPQPRTRDMPIATMRLMLAAIVVAFVVRCSNRGVNVDRADYGEAWPLTVAGGTLECEHESRESSRVFVTLDTADGIMYGLNGSARSFGYPDVKSVLRPGRTLVDVQPLIDRGLTLCR